MLQIACKQTQSQKIFTVVYNIQNYSGSGLCSSPEILKTRKHNVSETGFVSILR
jgi:hypothetical protein